MRPLRSSRTFRAFPLLAGAALLSLSACGADDGTTSLDSVEVIDSASDATGGATTDTATDTATATATALTTGSTAADATWDETTEVLITLSGDRADASNDTADAVDIDGTTVEIEAPGTYRITGTLADGNIEIDAEVDGLVRVVLDGVDIASSTTAPLSISKATDTVIVLADGSTNVLTDPASYVYPDAATDEPNAALFADDPLTITGSGSLEVNADFGDAIAGRDTVLIDGGTITVHAVDDGIRGNDALQITGGTITVDAGGDGLKSDTSLTVAGGTIDVQQSYEGLEAPAITIAGGTVSVVSSDDGINAASDSGTPTLTITGGDVTVHADGDGLDVNGSITMTGGTVVVDGPTENMNGAIDYDQTFEISGGVIVATGSSGMAMAPSSDSAQLSLLATFGTQAAGTTVSVVASDGAVIASVTPTKQFSSIAVSTPDVSADDTYSIVVDGQVLGTTTTADAAGQDGPGGRGGGPRQP
ncbi:MAG: carbohydrate-binding domain-containing protein [Acidimicrobiales bacterium]